MPRGESGIPQRYVLTFLVFWGLVNAYTMRVNLSVAIVSMAKRLTKPSLNTSHACVELISNITINANDTQTGEFDWDSRTQALILGSFFYGYVITQIPGGIIADKFGAKWLFGVGILVTSILTLLTPLAARTGVAALFAVRFIEGLGQGVTYPAMNTLIGKWIPQCERSRLVSFIHTGAEVGSILSMGVSGILGASTFLGGWPSEFYVFGVIGCIWFVFWSFLVYETPSEHPRMSASELTHIKKTQMMTRNVKPVPWKSILTSVPVWALSLTYFGNNWGFYTLLTEMPTYLSDVLHFDIAQNGMLSSIPFTAKAVVACLDGFLADRMILQTNMKITMVRKIHNSVGFFGPGLFILSTTFVGCHPYFVVTILSVATGLSGFVFSGFHVTLVEISPTHAGIVMGISNTVSNLAGFLAPAVVGWVVGGEQSLENWRTVFIICSSIYFVFGVVFDLLCTSEEQNWRTSSDEDNPNSEYLDDRL